MIIWPIFIGMIIGFIVLHITITFRDRDKKFTIVRIPGLLLALAGVSCIVFGTLNYTFVGKSILFLGVAFIAFAAMSIASSRAMHQV